MHSCFQMTIHFAEVHCGSVVKTTGYLLVFFFGSFVLLLKLLPYSLYIP